MKWVSEQNAKEYDFNTASYGTITFNWFETWSNVHPRKIIVVPLLTQAGEEKKWRQQTSSESNAIS